MGDWGEREDEGKREGVKEKVEREKGNEKVGVITTKMVEEMAGRKEE